MSLEQAVAEIVQKEGFQSIVQLVPPERTEVDFERTKWRRVFADETGWLLDAGNGVYVACPADDSVYLPDGQKISSRQEMTFPDREAVFDRLDQALDGWLSSRSGGRAPFYDDFADVLAGQTLDPAGFLAKLAEAVAGVGDPVDSTARAVHNGLDRDRDLILDAVVSGNGAFREAVRVFLSGTHSWNIAVHYRQIVLVGDG